MRRAAHQGAFLAIAAAFLICVDAFDGDVILTHDGPALLGSTITFKAQLVDSNGQPPSGSFQYFWEDDALSRHHYESGTTTNTTTYYSVSYPAPEYPVGVYRMQVAVCKWGFLSIHCGDYTSSRVSFRIVPLLNGNLTILQSNKTLESKFVSSAEVSKLSIDLRKGDYDYITKTATSISTYWFIDCQFYNQTNDFKFNFNFTRPMTFHTIQALIVASYDPPTTTTVAPTTTSTTTSSPVNSTIPSSSNTTSIPTSSNIITTSTPTIAATTTTIASTTASAIVANNSQNVANKTLENITFPYVCNSMKDPEPNKTYGYFYREVNVRAPISHLAIEGSTWIQPWNSLSLSISCNGSGPFHKCIQIHQGKYNITGNETCNDDTEKLDNCKFSFNHYFLDAQEYTILVILKNDVSIEIHPVAINIYKLTPKPQLSVIVVPVSCSLVAVVLIVFGIAYYVQSRSRFTVEVADFDFGQNSADMEYKTFTERLRDSFNNAGYKQLNSPNEPQ